MNMNKIMIERCNKIIIPPQSLLGKTDIKYVASMLKNITSLGFTFSKDLIEMFKSLSFEQLININNNIIPILKSVVGDHVDYEPMYPNFPEQVMNASDAELYINAILHYFGGWIGVRIVPDYKKDKRAQLIGNHELTVIENGTVAEFHQLFTNLMGSKTSISESDKSDLKEYIIYYKSFVNLPDRIYHKEILSFITGVFLDLGIDFDMGRLSPFYKSATDVLRLAVALSDGDVSLATLTRFRNFKRKERRLLLHLIEGSKNIKEEMVKYKNRWIRLGEKLHPGDYIKKFPNTFNAFKAIRNNEKIETFNSRVEELIKLKDFDKLLTLISNKPGEFARRLDHLIRIAHEVDKLSIVYRFDKVCDKVSSTVLLQLMAHFKHRYESNPHRFFFPKGNVAKGYVIPNQLDHISPFICNVVVNVCERSLRAKYGELEPLGKVFIDEALKDYIVPFSQRSASKAMKTIVRGSRFDLGDESTVRFFLYWKDIDAYERVDIDLSAVMFDTDWKYMEHISYTNLRSAKYKASHSGDEISAPNGISEFIDLDIESVRKYGGRYIMMNLYSFTHQPFNTIPICFAGWMMRDAPQSGEIYEPKTVQNRFDLASDTLINIPIIIDVETRQVIWGDMGLKNNVVYANNIEGNLGTAALMGMGIVSLEKPTLHELFTLHADSRGLIVNDEQDADIVFSVDMGIQFEIEKIMAEFL